MDSSLTMDTSIKSRPSPPSTPPPTSAITTMDRCSKSSEFQSRRNGQELTPPITPISPQRPEFESRNQQSPPTPEPTSLPKDPLTFPYGLDLHDEHGTGAWSVVRVATIASPKGGVSSDSPQRTSPRMVFAVKIPARKQSNAIILHEARILSLLAKNQGASEYIVPYHGFHEETKSIVMASMPFSLSSYMEFFTSNSSREQSSASKSSPIMGSASWLKTSFHLAKGLAWLHSHGIVHGDIKPDNILLPSLENTSPVFCDFSSARLLSSPAEPDVPSPTDALTTAYASPELLRSYRHGGMPTFASDVFSLAVSLVAVAIGEEPYAFIGSERMRKLAVIMDGMVLATVWNGPHALRVRKGGIVEQALGGALDKNPDARLSASEWVEALERLVSQEGHN